MPRAAKPWSKTKAARRVLSLDEAWAAAIRERVLADCHPWQRAGVCDPSRRISFLIGRGGAKTTTKRARAILKLTSIRRAELLYLATTREHARELNWDKLKDANEHYGLELRFNESRLVATCDRTGARYVMSGMEDDRDIERYRGKPFDEVQVDEAASHDPERLGRLIYRIIGPRLGERHGCLVIGGTPGHILRGEFYDATRPGSPRHAPYADRDQPGYVRKVWSSHAWSLEQVAELPRAAELYPALVNLWAEALVEKAEQGWSDDHPIWKREYRGHWAADDTDMVFRYRPHLDDGTPWNQWDPFGDHALEGIQALRAAVAKLAELEPGLKDWRYVISNDMGSSDPFACNVFSFSPTDPKRNLWHVLPFERTGMYARPIAQLTIGVDDRGQALHDKPEGIIGVIGWPDGMIMDADQATLDELGKVYGLRFAKADRNANYKAGAIELTNGDLVDGRIKIIKGSPLEQQLQQLQWAEDQYGKVKENKAQANHSTDTLIYGRKVVAHLFESGAVSQDAPTTGRASSPANYVDPQGLDAGPGIGTDREFDGLLAGVDFVDAWGNG
jgi:hypothetical protein